MKKTKKISLFQSIFLTFDICSKLKNSLYWHFFFFTFLTYKPGLFFPVFEKILRESLETCQN